MTLAHPLLFVIATIIAGGLTWWTYRRTVPALTPARRGVLIGLRFLALALVVWLLAEPVVTWAVQDEQPPVVAVLVDASQSLGLENSGVDLAAQARTALAQAGLDDLDADVRTFAFDADLRSVSSLDSVRFEGERTDVAGALAQVQERLRDENLRAVVLVSDGQYNTGRNPVYVAERAVAPVYTVAVGDTTEQRDVQLRSLTTNDVAYVGREVPVQVRVRGEGYAGQRATVTLFDGDRRLSSESVTLPEDNAELPIDLSFVPDVEGLRRLSASVTNFDGEVTLANNRISAAVRVLTRRQRLLLVSGSPSPDLAALRQLLGTDDQTEVQAFTQQAPGRFYEGALPDTFDETDALVLAGYPGPDADPSTVRQLAEQAEAQRVPVLFLLGRQTDLRLVTGPLADILPVRLETPRTGFVEAQFDLSSAGRVHPVLNRNEPTGWRRLPPLQYSGSTWAPTPDARVLATVEVQGVPLDDPMLVVRSRNGVRSAALLGAGVWRWKNVPEDLAAVETFFPDLFSNLVEWVTTQEDRRPVRIRPVRDLFGGGERIQLTGQVYDESLNPVDGASVQIQVTQPDGTALDYQMEALGNGRYVLDAGQLPEGAYPFTATASRDGETLGSDRGQFAVGALTLEFQETRADAPLMRQIARRSQGRFFTASEASQLPAALADDGRLTPVVRTETREDELYRRAWFLALIVTLLAAEWFLRKRSGMV